MTLSLAKLAVLLDGWQLLLHVFGILWLSGRGVTGSCRCRVESMEVMFTRRWIMWCCLSLPWSCDVPLFRKVKIRDIKVVITSEITHWPPCNPRKQDRICPISSGSETSLLRWSKTKVHHNALHIKDWLVWQQHYDPTKNNNGEEKEHSFILLISFQFFVFSSCKLWRWLWWKEVLFNYFEAFYMFFG